MFDIQQILIQITEESPRSPVIGAHPMLSIAVCDPGLLRSPQQAPLQIPADRGSLLRKASGRPRFCGSRCDLFPPSPSLPPTVASSPMTLRLSLHHHGLDLVLPEIPDYSTSGICSTHPFRNTIVRIPFPSWMEYRWISKIRPFVFQ